MENITVGTVKLNNINVTGCLLKLFLEGFPKPFTKIKGLPLEASKGEAAITNIKQRDNLQTMKKN